MKIENACSRCASKELVHTGYFQSENKKINKPIIIINMCNNFLRTCAISLTFLICNTAVLTYDMTLEELNIFSKNAVDPSKAQPT